MKTNELFDVVFSHRWSGKARESVELQNIRFWERSLPDHIEDINLTVLDKIITSEVRKGNKPSTINSKLQTLKTALDFGRDRNMHTLSFKVPKLKMPNDARLGFFSAEEQENIASLIDDPEFRAFFVWSIETGLRPSESRHLTLRDVRCDSVVGDVVTVRHTKNGDPRVIPLTKAALAGIKKYKDWSIFGNARITKEWAKLRRKEPDLMRDYVFYTCRHTCATRLLSRGVNIKVVQSWMGHKDINMTLRYAKLVPTDLAAARDLMDQ